MNKIKKRINQNYHKYHIRSMPHHNTVKRNAIFLNKQNSVKHELSKFVGSIQLNKWAEVYFTEEIIEGIKVLANIIEITMKDFDKSKAEFITEAVSNEEPDRIIDLVNLNEDDPISARIEFECDPKILKKNCTTIYI